MGTIISLILFVIVLGLLYALIGRLMAAFPFLIWILGIAGGITAGILSSHWWVGLLAGFFLIGILSHAQSSAGHECCHCGSYNTEEKVIDGYKMWICKKCNGITGSRR